MNGDTMAAALLLAGLALPAAGPAAEPSQTDLFTSGTGGYHTYRIPALIVAPEGTLLAFCEGRKTGRADHGDVDLVLRRSGDGGKTWGPLQLVHEEGGQAKITIGNPCPVVDRTTGTVWLLMNRTNGRVLLSSSRDEGKTWAAVRDITDQVKQPDWGWYAVGPGVGIQIEHGPHRGRLVVPCNHRQTADRRGPSSSHVITSDDHGKSWKIGGSVGPHTNESQVVETAGGALLINCRNHWGRSGGRPDLAGRRVIARSRDGGATWSNPEFDQALVEPQCQGSLLRYGWPGPDRKSRILFANPASTGGRQKMTVRTSYDDGRTWPAGRLIYGGSSAYCCLGVLPDGRVGLLYERDGYGKITFAAFGLDWLTGDRDAAK